MAASLQRNETHLREEVRNGRAMQERQVTMLHELNHRVKNKLATVQALARQSTRGGDAPGERLEARILALSRTHDLLTRDDWSGAPLRAVLENELDPYRGGDSAFVVEGPDVDLPPRHVLSLGMTLHELATNAVKHGALSVAGGKIRVSWSVVAAAGGRGSPEARLDRDRRPAGIAPGPARVRHAPHRGECGTRARRHGLDGLCPDGPSLLLRRAVGTVGGGASQPSRDLPLICIRMPSRGYGRTSGRKDASRRQWTVAGP